MRSSQAEEPLFDLPEMPEAAPDRRRGQRYVSLLRVGVIVTEAGKELCLIRNVSTGGLMAHVYSDLAPGARAAVELKTGQQVKGSVVWARDGNIGLKFDAPIEVADLLSACASADMKRPRMPRVEADCFANLRLGSQIFRARTRDVSQGGVKLKVDTMLREGDVVVTMSGFRPIQGVVRWCDGTHAGISFNQVIPLGELVPWLKQKEVGGSPEGAQQEWRPHSA